MKTIAIIGGGTVNHIANHLSISATAYGETAKKLQKLFQTHTDMKSELYLTKMAGGKTLETNKDIELLINDLIANKDIKVVIMTAAMCDYEPALAYTTENFQKKNVKIGKYAERIKTKNASRLTLELKPTYKVIGKIRKTRKDIFLVGFKTTCGATPHEQYLAGLDLLKKTSCNLVVANDTKTRHNMIITPEESKYYEGTNRDELLNGLVKMVTHRSLCTFVRSTVIDGPAINWNSKEVPESLRTVVDYCISNKAYKVFNGSTVGHFAYKVNENTFYTSIRRSNFNKLSETGLVQIKTDGPSIIAYGFKPSVGGQSQRSIFHDHKEYNCIVHFHCEKKPDSLIPVRSQFEYECGSLECGKNTSNGLQRFGNLSAVYLDNHGPNIVFHESINPQEVIDFIDDNFYLDRKTGGNFEIEFEEANYEHA